MLQTLLTVMLFIMPFLILQREASRPGLFTGLWVSLFFWGRLHGLFSILTFSISVFYYIFQSSVFKDGFTADTTPNPWIPRSGARPLTGFLAVLVVFCAFGNVCQDFGTALDLSPAMQEISLFAGFLGSLTGPVMFGALSDKTGPFSAFMVLLFFSLLGVGLTAMSSNSAYWFPFGSLLMQAAIGGIFTLMPLVLIRFYGRPQLGFVLPFLLLFLTALWTAALHFYRGADALPQDYLLSMVFLLVMAAPLVVRAWRRRLTVL